MIKIQKLTFDIGERVYIFGGPATITGYVNYNNQFFYIVVRDGSEEGFEISPYSIEKAA